MMKKAFILLLCTVMVFTSVACGSTKEVGQGEGSDKIEVEKELFDVTLTIPAEYVDDDLTQDELDADVIEKGFKSATLNDDDSQIKVGATLSKQIVCRTAFDRVEVCLTGREK